MIASLESGILVETVTVYGLLSSHDTYLCEPMKYFCDFTNPPVLTCGRIVYCVRLLLLFRVFVLRVHGYRRGMY